MFKGTDTYSWKQLEKVIPTPVAWRIYLHFFVVYHNEVYFPETTILSSTAELGTFICLFVFNKYLPGCSSTFCQIYTLKNIAFTVKPFLKSRNLLKQSFAKSNWRCNSIHTQLFPNSLYSHTMGNPVALYQSMRVVFRFYLSFSISNNKA